VSSKTRRPGFATLARRLARDETGTTAVETAICLPILLIILFGVFQFGWVQHTRSSLRFTLEQASRQLVIDPDTTEATVQTFVGDKFRGLAKGEVQVSLVKSDTPNGRIASLSASFNSVFAIPLIGSFSIPHSVSVTRPIRAS
jgi:Flp pilus assembly protein TadG